MGWEEESDANSFAGYAESSEYQEEAYYTEADYGDEYYAEGGGDGQDGEVFLEEEEEEEEEEDQEAVRISTRFFVSCVGKEKKGGKN